MKRLLIRLSSLGDVILCSSALEAAQGGSPFAPDWVVSREFAPLLEGHPRLGRVWSFERGSGLLSWVRLCRALFEQGYDEVVDFHGSLRSRILRFLFRFWSLSSGRAAPRMVRMSKQRSRLWGFFCFKRFWPRALRPEPVVIRAARAAGGNGSERPDLRHLVHRSPSVPTAASELRTGGYICVMPGSLWPGKRYPVRRWVDVLGGLRLPIVVLGSDRDRESRELVALLESSGVQVISGVGRWSLPEVAQVLAGARYYLGNDTGLTHLAEAVGTPAHVVFGPTVPEMGFGPWRPESRSYGAALACRPCGKDGRYCFRLANRYACMSGISASQILSGVEGAAAPEGSTGREQR